jgi:guanylate kinase
MSANTPTGGLITISAPSGAGKTSLVKALVESDPQLAVSVSHTTRPRRPGEVDGVNYHFVDRAAFDQLVSEDAFFEWAEVFGNGYGTSRDAVALQRAAGIDVILEIDWQGAAQVRSKAPDTCAIFILPPSLSALEQRLRNRKQDNDDTIKARLAGAQAEMSHFAEADYLVLNDDFETALAELRAIILAHRLRADHRQTVIAGVLDDLLSR